METKDFIRSYINDSFGYVVSATSAKLAVGVLQLSGRVAAAAILDANAVSVAFGCMATVTTLSKKCLINHKHPAYGPKFTFCAIAATAAGIAAGGVTYGVLAANPYTRAISIGILVLSLPGFFFRAAHKVTS